VSELPGRDASYWVETGPDATYPRLGSDRDFDVAVLGGGIAGITTALLLKREGRRVAVVEAGRVGHGASGWSTAKITSQHSLTYSKLRCRFGDEHAAAYGAANQAGLDLIVRLARELRIDCDLRRKPNYVYGESEDDLDSLREEADDSRAVGLPASFVDDAGLPWPVAGGVRFDDQAEFHPLKYIAALAADFEGDSCEIFEGTRATGVRDGRRPEVATDTGHEVRAGHVVVATHAPFLDRAGFFARMHPERSYVLGVRVRGEVPRGMYISTAGHSLRAQPDAGGELLLVGGESHKLGQSREEERYRSLEAYARERFEVASIDWRWATHDQISIDQVPYVGRLHPFSTRVMVATAFRKWGYANGSAAGLMLTDSILGRENPWAPTFDPNRVPPAVAAGSLVKENVNVGRRFFQDRLKRGSADGIEPGGGAVVRDCVGQAAVHRDEEGALHAVSARCTHLGCVVSWNAADRTWDCPCHGSRFGTDGSVLAGPAVDPLEPRDVG
jgi:glycine/D-amino acid oxidase-like deaminating enzyme/nitrite reductase/ring-hydroxylating ferredoxin subunit